MQLLTRRELYVLEGTLLGPIALILCYRGLHLWRGHVRAYAWVLVGVYILGPWFMFVDFTARGGGFAVGGIGHSILHLLMCSICPPLTVVYSAYDGTLFGLLIGTSFVPWLHHLWKRRDLHTPPQ